MNRFGKYLWKGLKALFFLLILIINVLVLWRVLFSGDPSSVKPIMANENTMGAYKENGGKLALYTQEQRTISSSGKFSVTDCVFIPEAKQIQITVRYNNSTLKYLAEDYGLNEVPDRKTDVFDVTLVKTLDLTPDNPDDNLDPEKLEEVRYYPSDEVLSAYKTLYSYRKYIFDGITHEDAVGIFVDFYYLEDTNYEETPYDALCLYDALMPLEERALSRADKKVLGKNED